jgi:hypothetical protein
VFAAILVFNLALRAMSGGNKGPSNVADATSPVPATSVSGQGPVMVGVPTAPPQEATRPDAYVTPGLAEAEANNGISGVKVQGLATNVLAEIPADAPPTFRPAGKIYGAAVNASAVTLQARRSAALIVNGTDGRPVFARQMQAGEAYRAPIGQPLSVDVSDPAAFNVYVWGQIQKPLQASVTPLNKIGG